MFKTYEITHIKYKDEDTERVIIPTFVPSPSIKAIDVTELSESEQVELQGLLREYADYYEARHRQIFSFEDWVSHTTGLSEGTIPEVKWRTFLLDRTKQID